MVETNTRHDGFLICTDLEVDRVAAAIEGKGGRGEGRLREPAGDRDDSQQDRELLHAD